MATILIVEDEFLIALDTEDTLRDLGHDVAGPALTLDEGLAIARDERIDAALLDVNLTDGTSRPIAELLRAKAVPFAYVTGYGHAPTEDGFPAAPVVGKPAGRDDLATVLHSLLEQTDDRSAA